MTSLLHDGTTLPTAGQFLRWLIANPGLFALWAEQASKVTGANTFEARWLAVRPLGDETAPALDRLFNNVSPRHPESNGELIALEEQLLGTMQARTVGGPVRDRKWLKAAIAAMKIGLPMLVPEASQWVGLLDLLGN